MEVADCSVTVMEDVDTAVNADGVSASAHGGGADQANAAGDEGTVNTNLDSADNSNAAGTHTDEDIIAAVDVGKMSVAIADSEDTVQSAGTVGSDDSADGAGVTDSRSAETGAGGSDSMDQSVPGDSNGCESDGDSTNERTCLEVMTPDVQDFYLRLGDTPRRRSALRLSRIIARQQLLRKLEQGRDRERVVA